LSAHFCGRVILRIPVDTSIAFPFQYNEEERNLKFIGFEETHPLRNDFRKEIAFRGCEYISITSANIHGAPTIEDLESAKLLAALFNIKASFLGMSGLKTVVADIPEDKGPHKGSYIILSFCNPKAIEIKRLANKRDRKVTERHLKELFANIDTKTPLVYSL